MLRKGNTMLCCACRDVLSRVKLHPPATWSGATPTLFDYRETSNVWAGAHHVEPHAFLTAARSNCYICATIYRDCSHQLRQRAHAFRTFYQLRTTRTDDLLTGPEHAYELEFTTEIFQGKEKIEVPQVFD